MKSDHRNARNEILRVMFWELRRQHPTWGRAKIIEQMMDEKLEISYFLEPPTINAIMSKNYGNREQHKRRSGGRPGRGGSNWV